MADFNIMRAELSAADPMFATLDDADRLPLMLAVMERHGLPIDDHAVKVIDRQLCSAGYLAPATPKAEPRRRDAASAATMASYYQRAQTLLGMSDAQLGEHMGVRRGAIFQRRKGLSVAPDGSDIATLAQLIEDRAAALVELWDEINPVDKSA